MIISKIKHEKIETHYQDMWASISSFYNCPLTGIPMSLLKYIESIKSLTYNLEVEKVNPKQQYFNTGATAYSSAVSYVITHKWSGTYSEWEAYSTAQAQKEFLKVMDRFNEM